MPDQMERMRAAVTMLNTGRFSERTKLIAFLSIQHPEKKPDQIVRLANAMTRADQCPCLTCECDASHCSDCTCVGHPLD